MLIMMHLKDAQHCKFHINPFHPQKKQGPRPCFFWGRLGRLQAGKDLHRVHRQGVEEAGENAHQQHAGGGGGQHRGGAR